MTDLCVEPLIFLPTGQTTSGSDHGVKTPDRQSATPTPNKHDTKAHRSDRNTPEKREKRKKDKEATMRYVSEIGKKGSCAQSFERVIFHQEEPEEYKPGRKKHKRDSKVIIFAKYHPFSNLYPAVFTVEGQAYKCTYQYILHQRALLLRDLEAAEMILKISDIKKMTQIKVKGFNEKRWEQCERKIRIDAAFHKFSQNAELRDKLLSTGEKYLGFKSRNL